MTDKVLKGRGGWKQDPAGVRKNILAVAMAEFAQNGLSGARIDEIAAKTNTSKRMIYYYFGGISRGPRWRAGTRARPPSPCRGAEGAR